MNISFIDNIKSNSKSEISVVLYKKWRTCETIHTIFAMIGFLMTAIDYEVNYSDYRTATNCSENHHGSELFRLFTLFTTIISLFFLFFRYILKDQWERNLASEKQRFPIRNSLVAVVMEIIYNKQEYKLPKGFLLEILLLMIIPYPYTYPKFYTPVRFNFELYSSCYTFLEVTYFFMYLRFIFLFRALANYTPYENYLARLYCKQNKVEPNFYFSFKCMLKKAPFVLTILLIQIPTTFILGNTLRIIERPLATTTDQDYTSPFNSWFLIFSMESMLGFGLIFPFTYYGRFFACIIGYVIGRFGFGIVFLKSTKFYTFDQNQQQSFVSILGTSAAARVIQNGMRYMISRKKRGSGHPITVDHYKRLKVLTQELMTVKAEIEVLDDIPEKHLWNLKTIVAKIDDDLDKAIRKAEFLLEKRKI